jgi:hypothetical protein
VKNVAYSLLLLVVIALLPLFLYSYSNQDGEDQTRTFVPPSVYMNIFKACSATEPCTRTVDFRVKKVPAGCCVLTVVNGDGKGNDKVLSYQVSLNGERVVRTTGEKYSQIAIKVAESNTLKVILVGQPTSSIFVTFNYDPRQSK